MAGKNNKCVYDSIKFSDSEDEYDYESDDSAKELALPLEKLNLGPKKKLLVMNLNGLLLHRVHRADKSKIANSREVDGRYRNYLDDALNYAIGASRKKMLFVWDQEQCTNSGFKCKENARKPLFFKELSKIFENVKKGGPFSASNTLLIDDKPYKAFLNPPNTGIFPESYVPHNDADKELDPNGELCIFLKGVAEAGDVGIYVKDHPFGQPAVSSSHPDWEFYSQVKESILQKRGH
ncbi:hypothetical protein Fmac_006453 [Flemingia macrophylla]|uniref:Mitochondrial import inner membrane translocase subunit TIM50 n=1 Tax=Flemingia macrophylla TaxID=520843 RepID=A0ABD1NC52_9FABA